MRVLVVEDDLDVARQVADTLRQAKYVVDLVHDGEEGRFLGDTEPYDAVVLDLGLPKLDGLSVLRQWRQAGHEMPVLILTARDTWREKVTGLRAGADDYLAKPFELEELLARVEALIRRSSGRATPVLECGPLILDVGSGRLTVAGRPVELTALEFRTLAHLMRHQEQVVSKTELTEHLYDQEFDRDSNVIEVLINRLRNKLGAGLIRTRRGLGLLFTLKPQQGNMHIIYHLSVSIRYSYTETPYNPAIVIDAPEVDHIFDPGSPLWQRLTVLRHRVA